MAADYLEIQKQRKFLKKRIRVYVLSGIVFVFSIVLLLMKAIAVYGDVASVEVRGNKRVATEAIVKNASNFIEKNIGNASYIYKVLGIKNFILWYRADWNSFGDHDPRLAKVITSFDILKRSVAIDVVERDIVALWCREEQCFWFDKGGHLTAPAPETYGRLVPKIIDKSNRLLKPGDIIITDPLLLANFLSILEFIEKNKIGADEIVLDNLESQSVAVDLSPGPTIYFSLRFKPDWARDIFHSLISNNKFYNLDYIDFRVENRVYYK